MRPQDQPVRVVYRVDDDGHEVLHAVSYASLEAASDDIVAAGDSVLEIRVQGGMDGPPALHTVSPSSSSAPPAGAALAAGCAAPRKTPSSPPPRRGHARGAAMIRPLFRDLETGAQAWGQPASLFWWTEGNGACDCNRAPAFGLPTAAKYCLGAVRFPAVDVQGGLEGLDEAEVLRRLNHDYPTQE